MSHGLKIAVTGAGGFIGGRTCEYLHALGHSVRPVVRSFNSAAKLSVIPFEFASADVMKKESLLPAFQGMDVVVHCAYGNTQDFDLNERITADGTQNVVEAAVESGVRRLVHMSSVAVYGTPLPDVVTEATPYQEIPDWYTRSKQAAEKFVLKAQAEGCIEAVAIQPAIVYGPWAGVWTVEPVQRIASGDLYLYADGSGICNTLYIDNLTEAIARACTADGINGERFLITDGSPVTWRDFFGCYASMLNRRLPSVSLKDVKQIDSRKAMLTAPVKVVQTVGKAGAAAASAIGLKGLAETGKRAFKRQTKWMNQTSESMMEFYCSSAVFDISRAGKILGYNPRYDLAAGMERTQHWLRFMRLAP